jgi:hypothetical protein
MIKSKPDPGPKRLAVKVFRTMPNIFALELSFVFTVQHSILLQFTQPYYSGK